MGNKKLLRLPHAMELARSGHFGRCCPGEPELSELLHPWLSDIERDAVAHQAELQRRIEALLQKGGQVLATSRKRSSKSSASILDTSAFKQWKTQSLSFLRQLRGADDVYTTRFEKEVHERYESDVKSGIGILKALYEDRDFASQVPDNAPSVQTNKVFVVQGHAEAMKQAVARTLS